MAHDPITWLVTVMFLVGAAGIVWQLIRIYRPVERPILHLESRRFLVAPDKFRPPAPPEAAPQFRRPAEFGPLYLPRDQVEHMRQAIILDQLGIFHQSAAQRRRRAQRMAPETEQDRVLHWLQQWQDNVHIRWATT